MPEAGLPWLPRDEILTYEEIVAIVRAAASVGVRAIRLTGGEPLVRRDLDRLVARSHRFRGSTTSRSRPTACSWKSSSPSSPAAGLRRVNVSLDTLARRIVSRRSRAGRARSECCAESTLRSPRACTAQDQLRRDARRQRRRDRRFCRLDARTRGLRAFHRGHAGAENLGLQAETYLSSDEILERIAAYGALSPVPGPSGNGPARYFAFDGGRGAVGVISPLSHDYCERCNRVRLTADGRLRLCLFGDHAVDLRAAARRRDDRRAGGTLARVDAHQAGAPSPPPRRSLLPHARLLRNRGLDPAWSDSVTGWGRRTLAG